MRSLVCITALATALIATPVAVAAQSTLSVGLPALPRGKGNPHTDMLDDLSTWSALFDPLTMMTGEGKLVPWLATAWRQENATTWIVSLRDGVVFSDGSPFDSGAAVAAIQFLTGGEGRTEMVGQSLSGIAGAEATDRLTIRITTVDARPLLPYELYLIRVPEPRRWAKLGKDGFAADPVGTGPFMVENWGAQDVMLRKAPHSWRQAKFDRLRIGGSVDPVARRDGFLTQKFDLITFVDPEDTEAIEAAGGKLHRAFLPAAWAVIFNNVKDKRFDDPRLRQALNLAVDKQRIIDVFFRGHARPSSQPSPRVGVGHDPSISPYPYDPDKAKALLADAGYADGLSFTMEAMPQSSLLLNVYQQVAADLARINVRMSIVTIPRPLFLEHMQTGGWQGSVFPLGFNNASMDALRIMDGNSCLSPHPWYCDPAIVPKIKEAKTLQNLDARTAATRDIMRYAHDTAQALFLYELDLVSASSRRVRDFAAHSFFILYENVSLDD